MRSIPAILKPKYWFGRPWRALGALLLLVLCVRLVWGWWIGWQLDAQIAEIRARGEPVEPGDVKYEFVPDGENALLAQIQAAAAQSSTIESPRNSTLEYNHYLPYPSEWMDHATASERANAPAFAGLRASRQLMRVQHHSGLISPLLGNLGTAKFSSLRGLASTVADGSAYSHLHGNDAEAIERILDLRHISRSLYLDDPLIAQLVAWGIDGMACHQVMIIAPGLRFGTQLTLHPANRPQITSLINALLDETLPREGLRRGIQFERVFILDYVRPQSEHVWVIRPLADRVMISVNRNCAITILAAECANLKQAQLVLKGCSHEPSIGPLLGSTLSSARSTSAIPRYSRWFQDFDTDLAAAFTRYFRVAGERRAAAISLACQLYRADHARWPDRLQDLVPAYLPALPADPFHDDGRPMGYVVLKGQLPGGGDRPMVYFDPGMLEDEPPLPARPLYGWWYDSRFGKHRREIRQYRDIARFIAPLSAKAVDDNP